MSLSTGDILAAPNVSSSPPADSGGGGTASTKKSNTMDMQDFLKLIAAQMQNQSLTSSSSDNNQYINEMALFSAVQAMNTLTSESNKQYAASLVGSDVVVGSVDKATGKTKLVSGTVAEAAFYASTGESNLVIDGKTYNLSDVKEVLASSNTQNAMSYLLNARQYAISLVGKNVIIDTTDKDGLDRQVAGLVKNVSFDPKTDAASVTLDNGETYSAGLVSKILQNS